MTDPKPAAPTKLNTHLASKLDPNQPRPRANAQKMSALLAQIHQQEEEIRQGGGAKAIEAQHTKQRLTARERLALLLDPNTPLLRARPLRRVRHV